MPILENNRIEQLTGTDLKRYRKKKQILSLLYKFEELSAPQIAKHLHVSTPTSLSLLSELISSKHIVFKRIGESQGGRKPVIYELAKSSLFAIACDMGRYSTKMTIFNSHNEQVTSLKIIDTYIDDPDLEEKLFEASVELTKEYNIPFDKIFGIGIDMPGLVDSVMGFNYTIKEKSLQHIKKRLETKFEKLVYVDNDARMQAFGEYVFGKAKGKKDAIIINWNWGIGLGMILNGELYRGTTGFAGEFSHIKMVDDGKLCICGKNGCLETIASANALINYAKEGIASNVTTQLSNNKEGKNEEITIEGIITAAKQGDEFSISILSKVGVALGKGLSFIIQLLNPEVIVLNGSLAKANQFVLTPIQQSLNKYCLEKISSNSMIVLSDLEEHSGLLGVTAKLYQKIFSDMIT